MKLLAICGMAGSGKTESRTFFQNKGFEYLQFGVTEMVKKKHGHTSEELEKKYRVELRDEKGMGVMAEIALPKIEEFFEQGKNVVVDNMYSWSEYKIFKEKYGAEFVSIAVHASPKTRYERVLARKDGRTYDLESIQNRDIHEIEAVEKGGPIAMADFHVVNETTMEYLYSELEGFYSKII